DSIAEHPLSKLHFHSITYTLESLHTKQHTSHNCSNKIRDLEKKHNLHGLPVRIISPLFWHK
ncbi:hypothetical protein GIB67_039759, partial [Kingdonia uniflora]